ncbi:hypothetical protein C8R47DRAFT_1178505 [Mycena vitilis]|nr:hypothetical protein C8R47DRAFT_1178505 [Mycena vitilis]
MAPADSEYRLPTDDSPSHYDLVVLTDLEALKFMGTVEIDLVVHNSTSRLVLRLNVAGLNIHDISLSLEDGQTVIPFSEAYDQLSERPTAARRALPAFDEPALKATFSISLVARPDTVSLSNMPQYSEEPCDSSEMFNNMFQFTPKRKTLDDDDDAGFAWKNLPHAGFALELTARVLPLYEKIFDIEYPLPKLDTLVVWFNKLPPAMENWGLITGRASGYLLANPSILRLRTEIVALQWLRIFPKWNLDAEFVNEHLNKAFSLDSGSSSHPVEVHCPDANKISQIFDGLSTRRQQDKFLKGVSMYLKERLYGNSTTADLWKGVEQATDIRVSEIMNAWISKPGFPVVTVQETYGGVHLRTRKIPHPTGLWLRFNLRQSLNQGNSSGNDGTGRAHIDHQVVLREREQFIALDTSRTFKLNAGTTGYYRVLYSPERLKAIGVEAAKETTVFSVADRIGLITTPDALSLIYALRSEPEYPVWMAIASNLGSLISIWWEDERIVELLNAFRRGLFSPLVQVHRLGYISNPEVSSNASLLRTCAITQALDAGDANVVLANELKGRFMHFLTTTEDSKIPPELVTATYTTAVRHGGRPEYEGVKALCGTPKNPAQALCAADDVELINETLALVLSELRDQGIMYFIGRLAQNIKTRRRGANFFMHNFDKMHEQFKDGFGMADLLRLAFSSLSTEGDRNELVTFFKGLRLLCLRRPPDAAGVMVRASVGSMHTTFNLFQRSTGNLLTWLEDWSRGADITS